MVVVIDSPDFTHRVAQGIKARDSSIRTVDYVAPQVWAWRKGRVKTMRRVIAQIERVAASESRICIYGETGTGKELVARTIHDKSPRTGAPFITLN